MRDGILKDKMINKIILRTKLKKALLEQGFLINPHLRPGSSTKKTFRDLQKESRIEQIELHSSFLIRNIELVQSLSRNPMEIDPKNIKLELREVKPDTTNEVIFRWWNFIWWSIPYQRSYGRQMRFLLWDTYHDSPFGLICLQSPILKMSVRDKALGIPNEQLDIWVNKSLNAQRVGALPPYNDLLGGKMVALSLVSNEIRQCYAKKYKKAISIIKERVLKPELLFITTTSAFGKSSLYNRLKYQGETVAKSLGYTQGSGTFHIPETLYQQMLDLLVEHGIDVTRGYGHGPSRKLKLVSQALALLGLREFEFHGIKREFYLFSFARNLTEVIQNNRKPQWYDRQFDDMVDYWTKRWAIPRATRMNQWSDFNSNLFFRKTLKMLGTLNGK
jgi:hypothetical protein